MIMRVDDQGYAYVVMMGTMYRYISDLLLDMLYVSCGFDMCFILVSDAYL